MSGSINMDSSNESLLKEKTITILVMALVTFLGGVLPLKAFSKLRHNSHQGSRRRWEVFISLCSCFSGGVFIAACFLDLIPETEELFDEVRTAEEYFNPNHVWFRYFSKLRHNTGSLSTLPSPNLSFVVGSS